MKRSEFDTGQVHQRRTARWIRRRLIDVGTTSNAGRCFRVAEDQDGVLLADPVGMGKTWEALAGAALILSEGGQQNGLGRVLVLCPPNLISKWEEELGAGSPFRARLSSWAQAGARKTRRCAERTLTQVIPVRRAIHIAQKKRWGKLAVQDGTYLVSFNLLQKGGPRVAALRRADWQVIIVDEAHHAQARAALAKLPNRRRGPCKLLLSATPFQLTPSELDRTAAHILRGQGPLRDAAVKRFVDDVERRFHDAAAPGPTASVRRAAEDKLGRLIARTAARRSRRAYAVLCMDGSSSALSQRLDRMSDVDVSALLERAAQRSLADAAEFESEYLHRRALLARKSEGSPSFVATELRRFLSKGGRIHSPRRIALRRWAERTFAQDLRAAFRDGYARKTIVFTSWVGEREAGEADMLRRLLAEAFEVALERVRRTNPKAWTRGQDRGGARLTSIISWIERRLSAIDNALAREVGAGLERLRTIPAWLALLGAGLHAGNATHKVLEAECKRLVEQVERLAGDEDAAGSFERSGAVRRKREAWNALRMWSSSVMTDPVVRYTGQEHRSERDWASSAFRAPGLPWALVASNVGAEGIDLHTYTRRIVHYDLEWNPAKMEQREGRGDRQGRVLKEPLDILYAIVPRTYDERMLHQLVARDRWHGVLLGKSGAWLAEDRGELQARLESAKVLGRMTLDLRPR